MKIQIKDKIIEMDFDLQGFKEYFKKDIDLEKSVFSNVKITMNKYNLPQDEVKRLLYNFFDWGGFIKQGLYSNKDIVKFKIYNVHLDGFQQIIPRGIEVCDDKVDYKNLEFKYRDFEECIMIIQDAVPNPNFAIDNMFCKILFDYGTKSFMPLVQV